MIKNYQPALRQDLIEKGFTLEHDGDHCLILKFMGLVVRPYSQTGITSLELIHQEADEWWNKNVN